MSNLEQVLTLLEKMDEKFTKRFDAVDQRFDAVDQRFEAVDQRFQAIDKHLEAIDDELLNINHKIRGLGLEFEKFRSDQKAQKEVLLELRKADLPQRVSKLEKRF